MKRNNNVITKKINNDPYIIALLTIKVNIFLLHVWDILVNGPNNCSRYTTKAKFQAILFNSLPGK